MSRDTQRRNYEGHTFGEWTVLHRAGKLRNLAIWKCRCSCGAEHEVLQPNLVSGQSSRCRTCKAVARRGPNYEARQLSQGAGRNRGESHGRAKLTEADVRIIRDLRGEVSGRSLALRFGVSSGSISDIQLGRRWGHVQ